MSTSHPSDPETEVPHLTESFNNVSNNLKFSSSCIGGELGDGTSAKPNNNPEATAVSSPPQKVPMAAKATNHCSSQSDEFVGSQVLNFEVNKRNLTMPLSMEDTVDPEHMHLKNDSINVTIDH